MATEMGLGGCAIGTANIDQFARMTGMNFTSKVPSASCDRSQRKTN
jgi:hypothetical protein